MARRERNFCTALVGEGGKSENVTNFPSEGKAQSFPATKKFPLNSRDCAAIGSSASIGWGDARLIIHVNIEKRKMSSEAVSPISPTHMLR
jgi:hypothetical protein